MKIDSSQKHNVVFPITNGELNISDQVGGSLTAILADMEIIWKHCLDKLLSIVSADFQVNI